MKKYSLWSVAGAALLAASACALAKPNVTLFATGGTIAGKAASAKEATEYRAGELSVKQLIDAVPSLQEVATLSGVQIANVPSGDIGWEILLSLAKSVNATLAQPGQAGVVITHGTDTLEETAFFLDLTVKSAKPVVVVGAMRPATAISADGPMNLLQAVTLAASASARERGVLVAFNDRIASGYYVTKTHANATDTFRAAEQGYLGSFVKGQPWFYYTPARPTHLPWFDISQQTRLPKVSILYAHQEQDPALLDAAVNAGAEGIVIAAAGNAAVPLSVNRAIETLMAKGIPVVLATRTGSGYTSMRTDGSRHGIGSGIYSPQKARILLALALAQSRDMDSIRSYFEQ